MTPEAYKFLEDSSRTKLGLSADPGKYKGPVIDFEKAVEELEEEEPSRTSLLGGSLRRVSA
jgi:hypothetical protein